MNNIFMLTGNAVAQSLEIMWKGMLSIFVVIVLLTMLVYIITKFVKDPKDDTKKDEQ